MQLLEMGLRYLVEVDKPIVDIVDHFEVRLRFAKEYSTASEKRLTIDFVSRYHFYYLVGQALLASVVCDWGFHVVLFAIRSLASLMISKQRSVDINPVPGFIIQQP
jgi:hypothetical protein